MSEFAHSFTRPPLQLLIEPCVRAALEEDLGRVGDLTTDLLIADTQQTEARLVVRKAGTVSGLICAATAFHLMSRDVRIKCAALDGDTVHADHTIAILHGPTHAILSAERVALNFLGHLSGIATATRALVDAITGTKTRVVCTRKTTPGLRMIEKYAVRCGGGFNHRFGLDDAVLIKDNHIAAAGSLRIAGQITMMTTARTADLSRLSLGPLDADDDDNLEDYFVSFGDFPEQRENLASRYQP